MEATLWDLTEVWTVFDVIFVQFGCMPRKMAKNKLVLKEGEVSFVLGHQGNYVQVSPGRGKPRLRFRRKLPGLVRNLKMYILVNQARHCLRPPTAWVTGPPEWASGTNEERAAKRRRHMAELQQKWRPLEADGYRLVSLLLSCTHDHNFGGIDVNNAFASALCAEDLYRRPDQGPKLEVTAFCRSWPDRAL